MNKSIFKLDIDLVNKSFLFYGIRMLISNIILLITASLYGLFESKIQLLIMGGILCIFFAFSIHLLFKKYRNRFLSIEFNGNYFIIDYIHFCDIKKIETSNISVSTIFFVNNYSRTSYELTKINLEFQERKMYFFLPLEDVLKIIYIIKTNGGAFQKDFDLKCSLKEIRTLKNYEDLYLVIDTLLE